MHIRTLILLSLVALAGCQVDWRAQAINNAKRLVREEVRNPSMEFTRVQFTGDNRSGQTCGYYLTRTADGGQVTTRFIVFIDGGGGQNPFIDNLSARYPLNKDDFALNWRTQCLDLGYKES
jgi:hypothetical protein